MKPLCLDLGTRTGYCFRSGRYLVVGTTNFEPRRGEGAGYRFLRFRHWLELTHKLHAFGVVYYEQVVGLSARGGQATQQQVYGGFLAILAAWCEERRIPYSGVPVPRIKKAATGKGNASKQDMIRVARDYLSLENVLEDEWLARLDDNAADAYLLLRLVESEGFTN